MPCLHSTHYTYQLLGVASSSCPIKLVFKFKYVEYNFSVKYTYYIFLFVSLKPDIKQVEHCALVLFLNNMSTVYISILLRVSYDRQQKSDQLRSK